ncbi:MAG: hypothetical protein WA964_21770 [Ilumatobacter sp.]|uniref:hypothetical protein n=1 Tax=Ilumatobacter sp. TaxID=1967498 RepID=UPI003C771370
MDVVVRTPHGDADIDIVAAPASTTLKELLRAVTGQAPPATTRVDGRAVATTHQIADLDLVIGSLIDTRPESTNERATGSDDQAVGLVQLTGRGAGQTVRLHHGRFRFGSARRLHAAELDRAAVETPAFDIEIGSRGVRVSPGPDVGGALGVYAPTLGAEHFDRELPWSGERLSVGGRLFDLVAPYRAHEQLPRPAPNDNGSISFGRSSEGSPTRERVLADAYEAAMTGSGLWARRRDDTGAYDVAFGIHADRSTIASVDLQRHRGVALVGSERFAASLARTMLVELATQHGPADLDIVIASTPDHIAHWNWAKWLPHVRQAGPASPPELFDDTSALAAWAASASTTTRTENATRPITLLVLDDISLWSQRDSPLRSLLIDPPPELRIMALCGGLHEAPGMCTSLVEEIPPLDRLAHLTSVTSASGVGRPALFGSMATQHTRLADAPLVVTDIHPALAEIPLAAEVARTLAPLDDLDARYQSLAPRIAAPTLVELVALATREPAPSTDVPVSTLSVPIGVLLPLPGATPDERTPVTVDLAAPLATIIASGDSTRHDQTVASLLIGAAAQRRPDELAILSISDDRPAWHDDLPHISGWAGREEADDPSRLIHRVAHVLAERPDLHVLIVIERAFVEKDPMPIELVNAMTELAESLPNVHAVLTGDHPDSVPDTNRERCGSLAWIGDGGFGRLWIGGRQIAFQGVAPQSAAEAAGGPTALDAPTLIIRPTTHGRAMTPLERRLTRSGADGASTDDDGLLTAAVARRVSKQTADGIEGHTGPALLPPPLPVAIGFTALLERHDGDGVPIGLVDRPERAENEAYWWQPGSGGSILAAGSPRSGMTSLVDLIVCGTAARVSADDLHLYAIEALPQRRRAFEALPHTGNVATPEEPDAVRRLIGGLHRVHLERLKNPSDTDVPNLVLLIGDVSRMVRSLPTDTADETMQQLADLAASGPSVGMNIIAIASRVDDLGPLARLTGDRLVGATSTPGERSKLGAPAAGAADRHPGRCWSTTADRRVQLATPPAEIDAAIQRLAPEPAEHRPPESFIGGPPS